MSNDDLIQIYVRRSELEKLLEHRNAVKAVIIQPEDLRISVHKSAHELTWVHITHLPSGITATSCKYQSQLRNKMEALAEIRRQLVEREQS